MWGEGRIKLNERTGNWKGITKVDRDRWREAYPAVDLSAELAAAAEWCLANKKRGRKKNYGRFLIAWFKRSQERGQRPRGLSHDQAWAAVQEGMRQGK